MRLSPLLNGLRFAAGIDICPDGVRTVVMSHKLGGLTRPCLEHIGVAPLAPDAMAGAELLDTRGASLAIVQTLGTLYSPRFAASLRVAMAIAPSATLIATVPRGQLERADEVDPVPPDVRRHATADDATLDDLEPAIRAHAEALLGLERSTMAVDWFAQRGPLATPDHLTIAAAAREHIDARIDAAAGAGLQLIAIDAEPVAALRACRYVAGHEIARTFDPDAVYAVLWLGQDSTHVWAMYRDQPIRELRMLAQTDIPASLLGSLAVFAKSLVSEATAAAAEWPIPTELTCAYVAGDLDRLLNAGIALDTIATVLGCPVEEFMPRGECADRPRVGMPTIRPASLAVAFGLALRAVLQ